jgi:hypothetical protein
MPLFPLAAEAPARGLFFGHKKRNPAHAVWGVAGELKSGFTGRGAELVQPARNYLKSLKLFLCMS